MVQEKQLKLMLTRMCRHYMIKEDIDIKIDENGTEIQNAVGRLINHNKIIIRRQSNDDMTVRILYHEFRHVWQWTRYPLLVTYYERHRTVYNQLYNSISIEIDAEIFAQKCAISQGRFWRFDNPFARAHNLDMAQSALVASILYNVEIDVNSDLLA